MGRPVNKRYFGTGAGNQFNSSVKIGTNALAAGTILSQRSTRKFRVTDGTNTGVCQLVPKLPADLLDNEMCILVKDDAGDIHPVSRVFNRVVVLDTGVKMAWTFSDSTTDSKVEMGEEGTDDFPAEVPVAPVNTVLPVITGNVEVGETLTVSNGTWTGVPAPTYSYEWLLDGVPISGETSNTYVIQSGDLGGNIAANVTATNTVGNATVTSAEVGPVV